MIGDSMLEVASNLPDRAGVRVLVQVLREARISASVGKVCGARVSAVYLGAALEVVSVTLEPFELDDADLARHRAAAFIAEVKGLEEQDLEVLSG